MGSKERAEARRLVGEREQREAAHKVFPPQPIPEIGTEARRKALASRRPGQSVRAWVAQLAEEHVVAAVNKLASLMDSVDDKVQRSAAGDLIELACEAPTEELDAGRPDSIAGNGVRLVLVDKDRVQELLAQKAAERDRLG